MVWGLAGSLNVQAGGSSHGVGWIWGQSGKGRLVRAGSPPTATQQGTRKSIGILNLNLDFQSS